jgi:hypothetical protein
LDSSAGDLGIYLVESVNSLYEPLSLDILRTPHPGAAAETIFLLQHVSGIGLGRTGYGMRVCHRRKKMVLHHGVSALSGSSFSVGCCSSFD